MSVWSATKISFLFGIGWGIVGGITLLVLWGVLSQSGAFAQLNLLLSGTSAGSSSAVGTIGFSQALGIAALLGPLNTIGSTITGMVGAALYNLAVRVSGGVRVGFSSKS